MGSEDSRRTELSDRARAERALIRREVFHALEGEGPLVGGVSDSGPQGESSNADPVHTATLRIDGDVPSVALTVEQLRALGVVDVLWNRKRSDRRFSAVPLEEILRSVGVVPGERGTETSPEAERTAWKIDVIATASDGFQAAFRMA